LFYTYLLSNQTNSDRHGDRHTKGGRGGRAPARDGKRTFDRKSGTGRGREISKGGGGGHNWGSDKNEAKKAEGPVTEGEEVPAEENGENGEEEEVVKEPEPEEDKTLSYEEYMAMKAKPDSVAFKPIQERAVENEFAGKAAARKEEEDFLVMGGGKQLKKKGQKKDEKAKLVLDFKVKSVGGDDRGPRRDGRGDRRGSGGGGRDGRRDGRRDRGGRGGGGRGGRGGGGRGLDATDPNAFPSLS
jgi:plasminogen activator inhibitor 1 RNA-binding protein